MQTGIKNISFDNAEPKEVYDFLKSRQKQIISVESSDLKLIKEGEHILLFINGKSKLSYSVSISFIHKVLMWFGINFRTIKHLPDELIVSICNENLKSINRKVLLHIENNIVVSLTGQNFTYVSDLEMIENIKNKVKVISISRNDFITRIFTETEFETEPIVGDVSAIGFNVINSETGFSRLKTEQYIYRYICSNGASAPIRIGMKHIYKSSNKILKSVLELLNFSGDKLVRFSQKLKESTEKQAFQFFPKLNREVATLIPSEEGYYFFKDLPVTVNTTKYDIYNYITDKAKKFDIFERYKLENFAGKFLLNLNS